MKLTLALAALGVLFLSVGGRAQDITSQCGCRYMKAASTSDGQVCRVTEALDSDCQLRWGPRIGAKVQGRATLRITPNELAQSLTASRNMFGRQSNELSAAFERPEFWAETIGVARKLAVLDGEPSPSDYLSAFLSDERFVREFPSLAIGAAILLAENDLRLSDVSSQVRQGLVGAIAVSANSDTRQLFLTGEKGAGFTYEIALPSSDQSQRRVAVEVRWSRGCIHSQIRAMQAATMIKTNWSQPRARSCE